MTKHDEPKLAGLQNLPIRLKSLPQSQKLGVGGECVFYYFNVNIYRIMLNIKYLQN